MSSAAAAAPTRHTQAIHRPVSIIRHLCHSTEILVLNIFCTIYDGPKSQDRDQEHRAQDQERNQDEAVWESGPTLRTTMKSTVNSNYTIYHKNNRNNELDSWHSRLHHVSGSYAYNRTLWSFTLWTGHCPRRSGHTNYATWPTQRERIRSVGRNSGHIFRRLWAKDHLINYECVEEIAVCNAVFRSTMSCLVSVQRHSPSSWEVFGEGPINFLTQFYKFGAPTHVSKFDDHRPSDPGD